MVKIHYPIISDRPSLITPLKLKAPAHSDPVKRGTFTRLFRSTFAFPQINLLKDCHLHTLKHSGDTLGFLREPTFCGQTMYPSWPSEELCGMVGQRV